MLGGAEEEHEQGHLQALSLRNSGWVPILNAKSLHGMEERHAYILVCTIRSYRERAGARERPQLTAEQEEVFSPKE